jgi:hypothetical protein
MKHLQFLLCVIIFFSLSHVLFSQPKLTVVGGTSFNFGDVYTDMTVKKIITLKNEGTDTLVISEVSSTCGCTAALISNDHIPPGDSGLLSISFNGKKFGGKISRAVSFQSNDPERKKVHITFTANVLKLLSIEPEYLMFNRVFVDSSSTQSFKLKNNSDKTIRILSVTSTKEDVVPLPEKTTLVPNDSTFVKCTFTPKKVGSINGDITVETDHPEMKTVSLRVFGLGSKPPAAKAQTH